MKVRNMEGKTGPVANQFIINDGNKTYFQSYRSVIVMEDHETGKIYLDRNDWDYSVTTGKYRNQFLGEDKKTTERKIKIGEYILADLNKAD